MKKAVLLVLAVFLLSIFPAACTKEKKLDVEKYRQNVKETRKGSASMEQKKAVEKEIFPNLKDQK